MDQLNALGGTDPMMHPENQPGMMQPMGQVQTMLPPQQMPPQTMQANALDPHGHAKDAFFNAIQAWHAARPDRPDGMLDPAARQDWRSQIQDWRGQRPEPHNFIGGQPPVMGGPIMQPGGGTTGAPLPGMPGANNLFPLNPGMGGPIQGQQVPSTIGQMPLNPGVGSSMSVQGAMQTNPYQLPTYGG